MDAQRECSAYHSQHLGNLPHDTDTLKYSSRDHSRGFVLILELAFKKRFNSLIRLTLTHCFVYMLSSKTIVC